MSTPKAGLDAFWGAVAASVLSQPPQVPCDPDLFTSNALFGQPGIYPDGSLMAPAAGSAPTTQEARAELALVLNAYHRDDGAGADATERLLAHFDSEDLARATPDAGVRAALVMLRITVAAPIAAAYPDRTEARSLRFGPPAAPGRVVGPPAGDDSVDPSEPNDRVRVVNDRYKAERPALIAASLAHDLVWTPAMTGHAAESLLHALVAMVHIQLVAIDPTLARTGTELARRQNSLAITMLNSRSPGSPEISLCAPDGPGTIPGGAPNMQSIDFWSVPFGPIQDAECPELLGTVLNAMVSDSAARSRPDKLDESTGAWFSASIDHAWLSRRNQVRVSVALGLISLQEIATAADRSVTAVTAAFDLDPAWGGFVD